MNKFLKLLCSLPIILILLYYIPFLGICLILLRYYLYKSKKYYSFSILLLVIGVIILIPNIISSIINILKLNNTTIPYLSKVVSSDIYINLITYSKRLITIGIIFLILSFVFRNLIDRIGNKVKDYITETERKNEEISEKNDLLIKEKQERAKNTHIVNCPHCGASNILTENTGKCKYCRRAIEYKK